MQVHPNRGSCEVPPRRRENAKNRQEGRDQLLDVEIYRLQ